MQYIIIIIYIVIYSNKLQAPKKSLKMLNTKNIEDFTIFTIFCQLLYLCMQYR